MKPWLIILYSIIFVSLHALGDGLFDNGHKIWGHAIKAVFIAYAVLGPFICNIERKKWAWFLITLACWHVVGYDYMYNLFRGLPWNYVGSTSVWDLFVSKQLPSGVIWGRMIFLLAAVFMPIRELR